MKKYKINNPRGKRLMSKITVFNYVTVDGFFAGPNGEIDWFKKIQYDDEWNEYSHDASESESRTIMFGHTTYEMMKSFWPTTEAIKMDPGMAKVMNHSPKIVFSKTLKSVKEETNWKNIKVLNEINREEIIEIKSKYNVIILGSGSIVQQFSNLELIDEYLLAVIPIVLGSGIPMFKGVKEMSLTLAEVKCFNNGIVLHHYKTK